MTQGTQHSYVAPRVNIVEQADAYAIEAELPGVPKDQIELEIKDGELILKGTRDGGGPEGGYRLKERPSADFYRSFALGDTIDTSKVTANMNDGVLTVTLQKVEQAKPLAISVN